VRSSAPGGRFDATNIIPRPEVSVITNVSMDHMQYLGNSVQEIALEKAGIIKKGGFLVTAEESSEIREILTRECLEMGSGFLFTGDQVEWLQGEVGFSQGIPTQGCSIRSSAFDLEDILLPMLGRHQVVNAATAVLAAQVLVGKGFGISTDNVRRGLEKTCIPGRLEIVSSAPLVVLDAAHNVAGAEALKAAISPVAGDRRLVLVTGVLDDKDHDRIAQTWGNLPDWVVVTRPEGHRSTAWEQLARSFGRYSDNVCLIENIQEAVARGWELADKDSILCITGSFYLLKRARQKLQALTEKN
jgi:dihydrofolate synthase/folylpolyglutamate synthase